MNKLFALLPVLALSFLPAPADSAPEFPITMEIEYGLGDADRFDMDVTIEDDGSYTDSDGDGGTWFYRRDDRTMLLRYEGGAAGFDLFGTREGRCFSGAVLFDEVEVDRWSGCAI